jgi:hypothetical protein
MERCIGFIIFLLVACSAPNPSPTPAVPPNPTPSPTPLPTATLASPASFQSGAASIGDPKAPELGNTGYDVQQYTLALALDPWPRT